MENVARRKLLLASAIALVGLAFVYFATSLITVFPSSSVTERTFDTVLLSRSTQQANVSYAYVSLLYTDEFLVSLRTLGASLVSSRTKHDRLVIATETVSKESKQILLRDGWKVKDVQSLANPGNVRWSSFSGQVDMPPASKWWGVYTKLLIFNMTEYERVVYLDADTIVLRNVDELFHCGGFCATLRHSEKFNGGVLVVSPSRVVFQDMLDKLNILGSYDGGDQGFLNAYFNELASAPLFDPSSGQDLCSLNGKVKMISGEKSVCLRRLYTYYNADVGLYIANGNRWPIPETNISILHYTLGPIKPWKWWSIWVLGDSASKWNFYRRKVPMYGHFSPNLFSVYLVAVFLIGIRTGKHSVMTPSSNHVDSTDHEIYGQQYLSTILKDIRLGVMVPISFMLLGLLSMMLSLGTVAMVPETTDPLKGILWSGASISVHLPTLNEIFIKAFAKTKWIDLLESSVGRISVRPATLATLKIILYVSVVLSVMAVPILQCIFLGFPLALKVAITASAALLSIVYSCVAFYILGCITILQFCHM